MKDFLDPWFRLQLSICIILGGFAVCLFLQFLCAIIPGIQLWLELSSVIIFTCVLTLGIPYEIYASRKYQISQGWIKEDDPFTI